MFEGKDVKIVLANAGAGKTHYIIEDITKELEVRRPEEIAFVTFTRKGAQEGLRRICSKLMFEPEDLPYFRTLHSLTFHALGLKPKQMFGRIDQRKFNKKYGFNLNRCEASFNKNVMLTKDSQYLDFYDLERSNALTSQKLADYDIEQTYYQRLVKNYETYKEENHLVDYFDCLINFLKEGEPLPCKIVYCDECQDLTMLQWQVLDKAFSKAEKIICVGDDKQCQPEGSKVLTKEGYKNIEDLTEQDSLITFSREDYAYFGLKQASYHPEVAHRSFAGELVKVTVNGVINKFTGNHRLIVRWLNRDTSLQCVYLMKRGDWYRIGQCQLFSVNGSTHFVSRMNGEKAEAGWILRICKTKEEALVYEQYYSSRYGIPQISWNKWYTKTMQDKVYSLLGDLSDKAEELLSSLHRDINYPMFNHEKAQAKSGGSCLSLCEACNLLPEVMRLPVYQGTSHVNKDTLWHPFAMEYEHYIGQVYSLDVPKYHTYVTAGGLTVHNSIFSYSGARPDILISLSKQFPVEHLPMSYRLPKKVFELANAITRFIGDKTEQKSVYREENPEGSITEINNLDRLLNFIDEKEIMKNNDDTVWYILSRNNCFLSRPKKLLEDALIPYWTADGFFMGGDIMQRLKDYENYRYAGYKNEAKKEEFMRKYGIIDFSSPFTDTNLFTEERKWVYFSYIERYGLKKLEEMCKWNPQILVSTVHHVKGGECEHCALMLDNTRRTKGNVFKDLDEELRILYVAVTRTKKDLILIDSADGEGYNEVIQTIKDENNLQF